MVSGGQTCVERAALYSILVFLLFVQNICTAVQPLKRTDSEGQMKHQKSDNTNTPPKSYTYTEGSPKEEVLRLQGKPDSINVLKSYREKWKYKRSKVVISTRSGCVIGWNNNGGLRVTNSTTNPREKERIVGDLANEVEGLARLNNCQVDGDSHLLSMNGAMEYYRVYCNEGHTLRVSCKSGSCKAH